jgi:hypothetical protein
MQSLQGIELTPKKEYSVFDLKAKHRQENING